MMGPEGPWTIILCEMCGRWEKHSPHFDFEDEKTDDCPHRNLVEVEVVRSSKLTALDAAVREHEAEKSHGPTANMDYADERLYATRSALAEETDS